MSDSTPDPVSDIGNEIEEKLKDLTGLVVGGGVAIGMAELARSLLQSPNVSEGTHFSSSSSYSSRDRYTVAEIWINAVEAAVGRSVFFLFQKYEELIYVPPGTKDGANLYFYGRGLPMRPGSDARSDLRVIVHIS